MSQSINTHHDNTVENELQQQDENMPDITFEPPTPFEAGAASLHFHQQQNSRRASTLSAFHQSTLGESPRSTTSDHTFAWQDSLSQESSSASRPSSTSGWSIAGTSVSGDDNSLFTTTEMDSSVASSPLQAGKSKSHARKKAPGHVSRPRNAFILFRSHAITNKIIPPSLGVKDNRAVSCIVATLWKSLPEEERTQWKLEAEKEKELHRQQYPNYQFKPGNCGTKGKMRTHAKTEETVKEQCEIIADQILRAHGRSSTREQGGEKSRKKKESVGRKRPNSSRNKDGLPRARKSAFIHRQEIKREDEMNDGDEQKSEVKDEDETELEEDFVSRHRSLSLPNSKNDNTTTDMLASWQAGLEEQEEEEEQQQTPTLHRDSQVQTIDFSLPWQQSFAGRRNINPAALRFTVPTSFGDTSIASPRTILSGLSISAPSPKYTLFGVNDRPSSAHRFDQIGNDAMLLSPIKSSFHDNRSGSIGWQSWSRYSYADIALPIMHPRQSIDSTSSRRSSIIAHRSYDTPDTIFTSQSDNPTAHLSLHHNFFSPTLQSFHQRYNEFKSHDEASNHQEDHQESHLYHNQVKSVSSLADADTTLSN